MTPGARIMLSLLRQQDTAASLPERLCRGAATHLGVDRVGLSILDGRGVVLVGAGSDDGATALEGLQSTLGEGPGADAHLGGRPASEPDLAGAGARRWPVFAPHALAIGVASVVSIPLRIGGIRVGALTCYQSRPAAAVSDEVADYVDAGVLLAMHLFAAADGAEIATWTDLGPNREVHQATGMVAVQASVGLVEALVLLRAHAFAVDRSLAEVAHDVVERRLRFDGETR